MSKVNSSSGFLKPFFRGFPIIIFIVAACVFGAKRYLRYSTPMYESTVKIKLADPSEGIHNASLYKDVDVFANKIKIGAEVELLKSEVIISKVVENINQYGCVYQVGDIHKKELYRESPIVIRPISMTSKFLDKPFLIVISQRRKVTITTPDGRSLNGEINKPITGNNFSILFQLNDSLLAARTNLKVDGKYEYIYHSKQSLIKSITANLDITSVDKDIPILRVSYKSPVAEKSADIVNAVANAYINDYIEEKYQSANTTEKFLNEQLQEYSNNLSGSESKIQNYRDANNIINIRQETETGLRKISDLKKQLASVQMNLEAIDSLNLYIKTGRSHFADLAPNFEAFTDLLSTEMVKKIKLLQAEKTDLLLKYTPNNDKVTVIDKKIEDLAKYLTESISNTQSNLRIKYGNLKKTIEDAEAEYVGLPEKEKDMTILERNFGLNEGIYRSLHEKRTEAQIAKAATISFHRIIAAGEVPTDPVSPNTKLITVFSAFLGFIFSIIGIYLIHGVKARVDNENIIYRNSDTPVETSMIFTKNARQKAEIFNTWALELELNNLLSNGSVLTVSSTNKNEGKTYAAQGLSQATALLGKKTLLINIDGKTLPQSTELYDVIDPEQVNPKWKIPAEWTKMMENWKNQFDAIIIDNYAFEVNTQAFIPMTSATKNFILLDSRLTKINAIESADEVKAKLGLTNTSFILNRAGYAPSLFLKFKHLTNRLRNVKQS